MGAADCRLHLSFYKLPHVQAGSSERIANSADARLRMRLWYLLYICDQHLSILHNRNPLLRSDMEPIERRDHFLSNAQSTPQQSQDGRLISQVSLLSIMNAMRDTFGSEQNNPVPKSLGVQFQYFSRELDQWYTQYSNILGIDP